MIRANGERGLLLGVILLIAGLSVVCGQSFIDLDLINALSPAVVKVITPTRIGSGTILLRDGHPVVITNRHVVDCGECLVTIAVLESLEKPPTESLRAEMEAYGIDYDFALGRITTDLHGRPITVRDLPDGRFALYAGHGDAATMVGMPMPRLQPARNPSGRGTQVGILGYPGVGEGDLIYTTGTISSVRSTEHNEATPTAWYTTDTSIFPGNSGGFAFNEQGDFLGIPTAIRFDSPDSGLNLGHILSTEIVFRAIDAGVFTEEYDSMPDSIGPNYRLPPTFGQVTLSSGFVDDPYTVAMLAGGDINIAGSCDECVGFVAEAPDFDLYYEDAGFFPLYIYAQSEADTTLLVNAPDGSWHFNDDSDGYNPMIVFDNPQSGLYNIWVGTWANHVESATLFISELGGAR